MSRSPISNKTRWINRALLVPVLCAPLASMAAGTLNLQENAPYAKELPVPDAVRKQAEAFSKTLDDLSLLFVGRQGGGPGVSLTYIPPAVLARLATALYNFQSYTAAPRQQDLDKLSELTVVAREASARLKRVVDIDLGQLNASINQAGIPRIAAVPARKP